MIRAPSIRAHWDIDDIGISAAYINRTDSLLKHTVAFHSIEKDIIPYSRNTIRTRTEMPTRWPHLEEKRRRLRSKTLVDFYCMESKAAMSDQ